MLKFSHGHVWLCKTGCIWNIAFVLGLFTGTICIYHPHPKDGEGNFFTLCLSVRSTGEGRTPCSLVPGPFRGGGGVIHGLWSQVPFGEGTPVSPVAGERRWGAYPSQACSQTRLGYPLPPGKDWGTSSPFPPLDILRYKQFTLCGFPQEDFLVVN